MSFPTITQVSVSVLNSFIFSSQPLPFYYYDRTNPVGVQSHLMLIYFKKNEKKFHLTAQKSNIMEEAEK